MIRRLFTTFITYPNQHLTSEFFQPTQSSNAKLLNENLNFLFDCAPCFPVNGNRIRVIREPKDFYDTLLRLTHEAKERISMASLYLGIGKMETDLLNAMEKKLQKNRDLKINILLDYTRGTRGVINSKEMIMPLIRESDNCTLSLYHTPALRGITKKLAPARWNEILGLQHMKIYLFDNTVVISGANLSNDYFTNRQDRYIEIEDQRLANFFANLIGKVQEFSLKVDNKSGNVRLHKTWKFLPYESDHEKFANEAKKRIQNFFTKTYDEQQNFINDDADTWIFPTLEMGQLNIHHDSIVMRKLLSNIENGSKLNMATGYFNLTDTLMDTIVNECRAKCSIVMAHPNANGFKGANFPAGGIPDAYSLLARKFYEQILKHSQENRISLLEYERPEWTYHAKGLWYTSSDDSLPSLTVIGSSNYGERSLNRDLESQICLVTTNKNLQHELKSEYEHLTEFAETAESQLTSRFIPKWVRTVVFLFKNFF
jgi:CDP-diacylglycerol---glycerol-3-phosphate 3-phosphatidyltransferase